MKKLKKLSEQNAPRLCPPPPSPLITIDLRWYVPQNIPKILFTDGGESSTVSDCTREYKINFEGFPENGC